MVTLGPASRPIYELEPRGPEISQGMIGLSAQGGGTLTGAIVDGSVRTWLTDADGQLVLVMWPGDFRARFDPLEIINNHGDIIARGGELVTVGGGFLKPGDPRSPGHERAFAASSVSRSRQRGLDE